MDGKEHMASNTTEELKAPKVVSAYTKKKAEPCDFCRHCAHANGWEKPISMKGFDNEENIGYWFNGSRCDD